MDKKIIYQFFTDDDFLLISSKIKEMEKITAGEIRISIKEGKQTLKKRKTIRQLAEEEFYRLNMNETRDRTGILFYLLLRDKQFYILADSGINEKVTQKVWDDLRDEIQSEFQAGNFTDGILCGIEKAGKILAEHFPIKPDDTNELSNKVVL